MQSIMTRTAALASYPISSTTLMTTPFALSGATGLPTAWVADLPAAGTGAAAVDQRSRNAKSGRPPRGNDC